MLRIEKSGLTRYEITSDGRLLTVVEGRSGGQFRLDGTSYRIRRRFRTYQLLTADGSVLASTHRPGTRTWSVESGGSELRFRRTGRRDHAQVDEAGNTVGTVAAGTADLSGVKPALQVFVLTALAMRSRRRRVVVVAGS
ncbi:MULTISPECIES: hypothetical protein [Amycolatopsis]|uniref:Uncharacterized protein n=1 Tax=Amycolatopsis dendrobii TaxID=2760662 RepID=A0A7W3Z8U9_9PSEU|nr:MULTISPECIES: hypothetical protein [Amycolatopsis]MBB1152039.1 hypothetical protein [Amycolatopsis dendrobii]UKD57752.1 hypothetical protein L3Q65_13810 [Amycolatopsis sp. FU40]